MWLDAGKGATAGGRFLGPLWSKLLGPKPAFHEGSAKETAGAEAVPISCASTGARDKIRQASAKTAWAVEAEIIHSSGSGKVCSGSAIEND